MNETIPRRVTRVLLVAGLLAGCKGVEARVSDSQPSGQNKPAQSQDYIPQDPENEANVTKIENGYLFCPADDPIGEEILSTLDGSEVVVFRANWTNGALPTIGDGNSRGIKKPVRSQRDVFNVMQNMKTNEGARGCLELTFKETN